VSKSARHARTAARRIKDGETIAAHRFGEGDERRHRRRCRAGLQRLHVRRGQDRRVCRRQRRRSRHMAAVHHIASRDRRDMQAPAAIFEERPHRAPKQIGTTAGEQRHGRPVSGEFE
jgi:hypothetical protein